MSSQIQVKPVVHRLIQFLSLIEEGKFKIPTFQRDIVWGAKQKINLFDSISKEYPIGSILLWQPIESFRNKPEIGGYRIDNSSSTNFFYILDGFQRLSTLFGSLTNPNKTKLKCDKEKLKKEFSIYYDLDEGEFNMNKADKITNIPVYVLIDTYEFLDYCDKLRLEIKDNVKSKAYVEIARKLSSTLIDYQIPSIEIFGGSIKDAVDIFSRVNSEGIKISQDWMLSALTSNEVENFNLGEIFGSLLNELEIYNFGYTNRDVLVQCILASFGKLHYDQKIEELPKKKNFIEVTYKTIESIKKAVRFLFEELLVLEKKLLPYNNQLVFLTIFFNNNENISIIQKTKLKEWFWITTYSNYFTIYNSLSKQRLALSQFKKFIYDENESPVFYEKTMQNFSVADLANSVSSKSVRSTALQLFLINYSNGFEKVEAEKIDSIKILNLFANETSHYNLFPIIQYFDKQTQFNFFHEKKKDVSSVFEDNSFQMLSNRYFLNDEMRDVYNKKDNRGPDEILAIRKKLITEAEKKFVEKYDISYNEQSI